jgi:peptidyl-prolyl cis-trans isomerase SurA
MVDFAMPGMRLNLKPIQLWLACAVLVVAWAAPVPARAQVVVVANGSPITELDIQQRTKLINAANHKNPSRQEVINELIDDRIKIAKAKTYGLEVTDAELENGFEGMARRQKLNSQQFTQLLERSGISPGALKARMKVDLTWSQLIRGKYGSSLQIGEADIANALRERKEAEQETAGYIYTLYPITLVADRGQGEGAVDAKRREAENLRSRFTSCNEGLAMVRALRNVAVREPVHRSSSDLPQQLRELLGGMEVGRLTTPEVTAQGLQMFALCEKKQSNGESVAKKEVREEIFNKRFEAEGRKYLEEIRKQAMIEYK